jgi:hypothetical protein
MSHATPADFWLQVARAMETLETYFRSMQTAFEKHAKSSDSMTQEKAELIAELQAFTDAVDASGLLQAIIDAEDYPLLFAPKAEGRVLSLRGTMDESAIEQLIGALQDAKDAYVDYYIAHDQTYDADIVAAVNDTITAIRQEQGMLGDRSRLN